MIVAIGSDHAGFEQKQQLVRYLRDNDIEVLDLGPSDEESVDYPDFAAVVGRAVAGGEAEVGVLVCGTGIGMAIAANKVPGVRAVNIVIPSFAKLAREHNDANVLTLSGRFVSLEENTAILDEFLSTDFGRDRHSRRVDKISALENDERA